MSTLDQLREICPRYRRDAGLEIVRRVAEGESIISICRLEGMPSQGAVWSWRLMGTRPDAGPDVAEFSALFEAAIAIRADVLADQCQDIADNDSGDLIERTTLTSDGDSVTNDYPNPVSVARAKLRIDTRFRLASIYAYERYGSRRPIEPDEQETIMNQHRLVIQVDPTPLSELQARVRALDAAKGGSGSDTGDAE